MHIEHLDIVFTFQKTDFLGNGVFEVKLQSQMDMDYLNTIL